MSQYSRPNERLFPSQTTAPEASSLLGDSVTPIALDQVVDEEHRRPERGQHEKDDEGDCKGAQPAAPLGERSRAEEQHGEEHPLDGRDEPRHADRAVVRQPDAQTDVEPHEDDQRDRGRPA